MTNNPFYAFTIQNRTDKQVDFKIQPDEGPLPEQTPIALPNGMFMIPIIQPQGDVRHISLGRFMDQWSKLEMQIARLLGLAINKRTEEMPVIMHALGSRGQRECLEALLLPRLNDTASAKLQSLLILFKNNATRRNFLAHGYWHLEVVITERNGVPWPNYRQYRRYNPSDAAIRRALDDRSDPKPRKTYMFNLARINSISSELDRLWHEFSRIVSSDLKDVGKQAIKFSITDAITTAGFGAKPIAHRPTQSGEDGLGG